MSKRLADAFAVVVAVAVFAAFWGRAVARLDAPPAPLDDVFIHFGFARSLAFGHPMEWIIGNGYSSGATSLLYPALLAPFVRLGFDGERLGYAAAFISVLCVVDALRSASALLDRAPGWARVFAPLLLVAVPLVDWSLCSGMETALFAAVLGRAATAVRDSARAGPMRRARVQRWAGIWIALLIATRPEAIALAIPLAVAVAYGGGALPAMRSLARATLPAILLLGIQAGENLSFTGEIAAAGAVRKLVTSNPYAAPAEIAIEVVKNVAALRTQISFALGPAALSFALPLLIASALFDRRARLLGAPLVIGGCGALALVCFNTTARFQNLRYAVPALLMFALAAAIGAGMLATKRGPIAFVSKVFLALALVAPSTNFPRQMEHFAVASANIRGQQIEVGRRLGALDPGPRRIFVNDAGAIPYVSRLPAIDGLGLGGYHELPFARASVHGVPAVIELIKRLTPRERPDLLAIYPGWWPGLADVFGHRIWSVKIENDVICGADEKVVLTADWSALAAPGEGEPPGVIDELDVADLVDERAHAYAFTKPHAGYAIGAVLRGEQKRAFWDGGRIIPEGAFERFVVASSVAPGPAELVLRSDAGDPLELEVNVSRRGARDALTHVEVPMREAGRWHPIEVPLADVAGDDVISITAKRGTLRDFHLWITRSRVPSPTNPGRSQTNPGHLGL